MYNIAQPNFKGSFIINYKNTPSNMRQELEKNFNKKGKIIFENFEGDNTVLYVLRDTKDYHVANFINKNQLKFKYMPDISSKLQFENSQPDVVSDYIKQTKPKVIKKISELMTFVQANREKNKAIKDSHLSLYQKALLNLKINTNIKGKKNAKGIYIIKDTKNDGIICFSPKSKNGISYIYVKPSNSYDEIMRYSIDEKGNILRTYQTPEGIKVFSEKFNQTIKHHLHLD